MSQAEVGQLYNGGAGLPYAQFSGEVATPTPTPTATATATAGATPTATATATATATPTATPNNTLLTNLYAYYKLDEAVVWQLMR